MDKDDVVVVVGKYFFEIRGGVTTTNIENHQLFLQNVEKHALDLPDFISDVIKKHFGSPIERLKNDLR